VASKKSVPANAPEAVFGRRQVSSQFQKGRFVEWLRTGREFQEGCIFVFGRNQKASIGVGWLRETVRSQHHDAASRHGIFNATSDDRFVQRSLDILPWVIRLTFAPWDSASFHDWQECEQRLAKQADEFGDIKRFRRGCLFALCSHGNNNLQS
jgi:hypothetical protein